MYREILVSQGTFNYPASVLHQHPTSNMQRRSKSQGPIDQQAS